MAQWRQNHIQADRPAKRRVNPSHRVMRNQTGGYRHGKKLFVLVLIALSSACLVLAPHNRQSVPVENSLLAEIRSAPVVKLEYADQPDHQLVFVDNAGSTASIADMDIDSSQDEFSEEWLYRFTYNPREKVRGGHEIVVLLGSTAMEIDGTTFTSGDGVAYDAILDWAEGVYNFYQAG